MQYISQNTLKELDGCDTIHNPLSYVAYTQTKEKR